MIGFFLLPFNHTPSNFYLPKYLPYHRPILLLSAKRFSLQLRTSPPLIKNSNLTLSTTLLRTLCQFENSAGILGNLIVLIITIRKWNTLGTYKVRVLRDFFCFWESRLFERERLEVLASLLSPRSFQNKLVRFTPSVLVLALLCYFLQKVESQ